MVRRYSCSKMIVGVIVGILLAFTIAACSSDDEDDTTETSPPPAAQQTSPPPAAPPPAAPPAAAPEPTAVPESPSMMSSMTPSQCYVRGDLVTDCPTKGASTFEAAKSHTPGTPWLYHSAYTGPLPEEFYESPLSAQLVKQGQIPPLNERLPVPEDVSVVLGPDGIGEYGGAYRITEIRSYTGEWIAFGFVQRDSDEINFGPGAGKSWEASEDGREYTYTLRNGLKWDDGVPLTVEDVRFAFEDHNFNKEINPFVPAQMTDPVTGEQAQFSVVDDLNFKIAFDSPN